MVEGKGRIVHELGITQEIIDIVTEHADGARVKRVVLQIGKLTAVMPSAIEFCFDLCSADTVLNGAKLEIVEIPGTARCRTCAAETVFEQPFGQCQCGGTDLEWLAGMELKIQELELG